MRTKKRSKRDIIGAESCILCLKGRDRSYRPPTGFAAAKIDARAFKVAFTPATEIPIKIIKHLTVKDKNEFHVSSTF